VTAAPDEPVGEVRARVAGSPYEFALVVAGDGTLVGRLGAATIVGDPTARAEAVMEAGPSTARPDRRLEEPVALMREHDVTVMLVTTPEYRLLGVLSRRLAGEAQGKVVSQAWAGWRARSCGRGLPRRSARAVAGRCGR
jgi:CBS domain-containing protein